MDDIDIVESSEDILAEEISLICNYDHLKRHLPNGRSARSESLVTIPALEKARSRGDKVTAYLHDRTELNIWSYCEERNAGSVHIRHHHRDLRDPDDPKWDTEGQRVEIRENMAEDGLSEALESAVRTIISLKLSRYDLYHESEKEIETGDEASRPDTIMQSARTDMLLYMTEAEVQQLHEGMRSPGLCLRGVSNLDDHDTVASSEAETIILDSETEGDKENIAPTTGGDPSWVAGYEERSTISSMDQSEEHVRSDGISDTGGYSEEDSSAGASPSSKRPRRD